MAPFLRICCVSIPRERNVVYYWYRGKHFYRLHTHPDDPLHKIYDMPRVLVTAPVIRIVPDLGILVDRHRVTLHDPLDSGFPVHDIVVGLEGDAAQSQVGIVDNRGLVGLPVPLAKGHLGDTVVGPCERFRGILDQRIGLHRLVVQVPVAKGAAGPTEGPEVARIRNAWEHLLEVGGEAFPIVRGVEDAVDVPEEFFLADRGVRVMGTEGPQGVLGDRLMADIAVGVGGGALGKDIIARAWFVGRIDLFVPVERKALTRVMHVEVWDAIGDERGKRFARPNARCRNDDIGVPRCREEAGHLVNGIMAPQRN